MNKLFATLALAAWVLCVCAPAMSGEAPSASADPVLEAKVQAIALELRCLVCQNQTIADSHADLAIDLRNQIRTQLQAGQSQADIMIYMTDRYGDFVRYRPPFKASTWLLWFGPMLLVGAGLLALFAVLRRRKPGQPPDDEAAATPSEAPPTFKDTP